MASLIISRCHRSGFKDRCVLMKVPERATSLKALKTGNLRPPLDYSEKCLSHLTCKSFVQTLTTPCKNTSCQTNLNLETVTLFPTSGSLAMKTFRLAKRMNRHKAKLKDWLRSYHYTDYKVQSNGHRAYVPLLLLFRRTVKSSIAQEERLATSPNQ